MENKFRKAVCPLAGIIIFRERIYLTKFNVRFSKKAIKELPNNKPGVYIIKNNCGTNMFAGIAKRGQVQETLHNHFYGGDNYIPGAWLKFEQFNNLTDSNEKLKAILDKERPKYN